MRLGLALLTVALLAFPSIASEYQISILAKFIVFGIFALSVNLIWGYGGIVSFGHAIFFGGGAYATGLMLRYVPVPGSTWLAIVVAILAMAALGMMISYFLFYGRVSGVFFGVVTLALTGVMQSIVIVGGSVTGGLNGLYDFPIPKIGIPELVEFDLFRPSVAYYAALAGAILSILAARFLIGSDFGRVVQAIREKEDRVEFLGYDVPFLKMVLFTVSCGMAGLAGALYVPVGFISPDLLGLERSAAVLVWVAVGGRGSIAGAFIGALVVNYLQTFLSDRFVTIWLLFVGVLSILVVLYWPRGIVGALSPEALRGIAARIRPPRGANAAHR